MQAEFWHQRWRENQLGFHQEKVNSRLIKFWPRLKSTQGEKVFVPLCGKSTDMIWLSQQGFKVFGIEISEIACRDFFIENDLTYENTQHGKFEVFRNQDIELWAGDFFDLTPQDLANVQAVYDRAALVALPKEMRSDYAGHLSSLLKKDSLVMLVSMEYQQEKMKGPPFSVIEEEIRSLFDRNFSIEIVSQSSGPDIVGSLKQRGLDTLTEKVFIMTKLLD